MTSSTAFIHVEELMIEQGMIFNSLCGSVWLGQLFIEENAGA
jgi:hypothetical protein